MGGGAVEGCDTSPIIHVEDFAGQSRMSQGTKENFIAA